MEISAIQEALRFSGVDGWLFFDHHRRDPLAYRILQLNSDAQVSRRWYYFIPSSGTPQKLVHRIESKVLDNLPGESNTYYSWADQHARLGDLLAGCSKVAMQYSPNCAIPYVSLVDGGTIELVKSLNIEVVTSANLVQMFEACWTERQLQQHLAAGKLVDQIRREAFDLIGERLRSGVPIDEYETQQFILSRFSQSNLITDHGPVVAVNQNAANPHYEPTREASQTIGTGDLVLIDLWAKLREEDAVYYDITWTGFCDETIPNSIQTVFDIVKNARKRTTEFIIDKCARRQSFAGFEVDDVARQYIGEHGYADNFFHRTGHSIGTDVHGTGANMDNLESHDERLVIPGTCFSVEPGIYLSDFGIRSEVNVFVGSESAKVTGEQQERLVRI